jgi:uncharacterized protein
MTDFHAQTVQMSKLLQALDGWLEKAKLHAEAKSFDPAVLLQSRLAPDMYPLTRQIQAVCDGVKFLAARTAGKEPPKHPDSDTATFDELRARIRSVLEYTASFTPKDFEGAEQRVIPLGFMPGKGLAAADFVREMSVPNTHFHLCMCYAILRHNGVALGKQDFIASLTLKDI